MDPVLIGALASAGVLCIVAAGYRAGYRAGLSRGYRLADQWRETAVAMNGTAADNTETLSISAAMRQHEAVMWRRRANGMGRMLKSLGYSIQEIEDSATGQITYRALMVQPAQKLPLGPSMS